MQPDHRQSVTPPCAIFTIPVLWKVGIVFFESSPAEQVAILYRRPDRRCRALFLNPGQDEPDNIRLLCGVDRPSSRDAMPFFKTASTTGRRGVLSDKNGVPLHRRLLSVIGGMGYGEAPANKIRRMPLHRGQSLSANTGQFFGMQPKTSSKTALLKVLQYGVCRWHTETYGGVCCSCLLCSRRFVSSFCSFSYKSGRSS